MPASKRAFASERFRGQVDELFASGRELGQILEEVARLGVALLFQTAFEPACAQANYPLCAARPRDQ
jgi:hypothetical protein